MTSCASCLLTRLRWMAWLSTRSAAVLSTAACTRRHCHHHLLPAAVYKQGNHDADACGRPDIGHASAGCSFPAFLCCCMAHVCYGRPGDVSESRTVAMPRTLECHGEALISAAWVQLWKLQPWLQQQVNATLRELKGLRGPTVTFHVRGGDLLAYLINNVSSTVRPERHITAHQCVSR